MRGRYRFSIGEEEALRMADFRNDYQRKGSARRQRYVTHTTGANQRLHETRHSMAVILSSKEQREWLIARADLARRFRREHIPQVLTGV